MIVNIEQVMQLLEKNIVYEDGVSAREALTILFSETPGKMKGTITYQAIDGTNIGVDINNEGQVVSLEFF